MYAQTKMYFTRSGRSHSVHIQSPPLAEKITEEPPANVINKHSAQSTVTCMYQANIAGYWRNVSFIWCKNLMNHSFTVKVDSIDGDFNYTCKIELKPWHFWSKKGYKSFEVDGNPVEVYWDLRSAKFAGGPEPCTDFYIALVSDEEVVLLLGDYRKKAYKRTKSRPALVDAVLVYKKENVFAKRCFSTRAKFNERKDHDIVVESSTTGPRDPEMWISIDGIVLVHVKNLQWKFRGNQTVLINKFPVQVFWDVHDWLFSSPGMGHGLFIFKPGATLDSENESREGSSQGGGDVDSDCSSGYYSTWSNLTATASEFCLFLHAWKIE
ncbi:uncharacterized protein LOC112029573 [Quercus suber]